MDRAALSLKVTNNIHTRFADRTRNNCIYIYIFLMQMARHTYGSTDCSLLIKGTGHFFETLSVVSVPDTDHS